MLRYSWLSDVKFFRSLGKIHRLADRQKSIDSKIQHEIFSFIHRKYLLLYNII